MKLLFIGGVFAKENTQEIILNSKQAVDFAANIFQEKLIEGLGTIDAEVQIISAPFIGHYPKSYSKAWFKGFLISQEKYKYVDFCNIWGVRNFSRYAAIKNTIEDFISLDDDEKIIIVYSAHTPFLKAAVYAKRKDPRIKICLVVLDLPQYMNLSKKQSMLYKIAKKYDINQFQKLNKMVDSYVLLTAPMKEVLDIHNRPYIILEGIVKTSELLMSYADTSNGVRKSILYAGALYERYGVKTLIDSFTLIKDEGLKLVICGRGDLEDYIKNVANKDPRIFYKGQVTPEEVKELMNSVDLLVNPRPNNEIYTRYSFPSKNIEYLLSGKPVLGYKLDGMPECYRKFMTIVKEDSHTSAVENMAVAIQTALNQKEYSNALFISYAKENLCADKVAVKIVDMLKS